MSPFIKPVWLRRGSSQRSWKGATPQLRNGQRSKGSWPIASMNCWRLSLPSTSHRIARPRRSLAFCAGRSAKLWGHKSIHEISKRDIVELISAIEQRGAPVAANKTLKTIKTFLRWCVGRAVLDQSPADGVPLPAKEVARDRVLTDPELAQVILAARTMGGPYGGIVELLALTGQRREEVAGSTWDEFDLDQRIWTLPKARTKNAKQHTVHLSAQAIAVLKRMKKQGPLVFSCPWEHTVSRIFPCEARA